MQRYAAMKMPPHPHIPLIRDASRRLVRELGFMRSTLAGSAHSPSAVHALVEIGAAGALAAARLCDLLLLDKSTVSRLVWRLIEAGDVTEAPDASDRRVKLLSLTPQGRETLAAIDGFAEARVAAALDRLPAGQGEAVLAGLAGYADALRAARTGQEVPAACGGVFAPNDGRAVTIEPGHRPGLIGRAVAMHARYYARTVGFGAFFEAKVAAEMAEFAGRLDRPGNAIWAACAAAEAGGEAMGETICGTITIDGEDMTPPGPADMETAHRVAHLRWFIVDDGRRGGGIGRRLLAAATGFCDAHGFAETQLWTFRGLDAARRLYEAAGFVLAEERPGRSWGEEVVEQRFVRPAPVTPARAG